MPTAQQIAQVFQNYVDAMSAGDVETIVSMYAPDAVVQDPVGSPAVVGHAAIREFYAVAAPQVDHMILDGNPRIHLNTGAAPMRCFPKEPQGFCVEIVDVMVFNEQGKITSMTAYWGETNFRPAN
ncbi:MAG TPA: nuclear transport factor 2 family protein [Spongiibacteraceae bacterium]|jgi:steroid delta-isomerase|nr:nuclear transport factor 2 family protein [Spongiibacteraceae bacterium]